MSQSFAARQRAFRSNPKINPDSGRPIKRGTKKYDELVTTYGAPVKHRSLSPKRSPKKSPKKSPVKTVTTVRTTRSPNGKTTKTVTRSRSNSPSISPVKRTYRSLSPRRTLAKSSPGRLQKNKDIFTVLPEESVVGVLRKLDNNYKQEWIASSDYVRGIAMKHNLN